MLEHFDLGTNFTQSNVTVGAVNGTEFYQSQISNCLQGSLEMVTNRTDHCRIQLRKQGLFCYAAQTNFFHARMGEAVFYAPKQLSFAQFVDGCHF
ncbi:hypothetical protein L596_025826 [Steinernema carpocapsae]|uniref:Uncharacterized protein n=1 Tax=Steinernema carpocapsae TaxID=34508 RepID=A0A4U5M8X4_STECR|nr:hypothetical protein L596_025826 [Steinernema carpocapsae]